MIGLGGGGGFGLMDLSRQLVIMISDGTGVAIDYHDSDAC